jgi:Kdo2-lipid IVA lauroyltransferase/acyltransferase
MHSGSFEEVVYRAIKCGIKLLSRLSGRRIELWAGWIGRCWYALDKHHRAIALENLAIAYGNTLDAKRRNRLARANFIQLTRVLLEIPSLRNLSQPNLHRYVIFKGRQHVRSALRSGKAVVFLTAHLGHWELMALAVSLAFDLNVNIVARPLDLRAADRVLWEIRTRTGNRVIDKFQSMAAIGRLLREKKTVGILLDQNASWYEGVYVPFFGRSAGTNKGLALLARRYDAQVVPAFNHRLPDGRYAITFDPPLDLYRTASVADDIISNTALFNRVIEKHIRDAPDNWFWLHRRWRMKSIPNEVRKRIGNLPPEPLAE